MRATTRRWVTGLMAALSVIPALSGCGGNDSPTQTAPSGGVGGSPGQGGAAGSGTAGSNTAGSGTAGSGTAGTDAAGNAGAAGGPDTKITAVIDLRADTNRDGKVDLEGDADDKDEDTWDKTHGAIFLANIDDDEKKCPTKGSDIDLPKCHDAADDVVNGADDLADLARLKTAPWAEAPDDASGKLKLDGTSAERVRLFKNDGGSTFTVFDPAKDSLSAAELRTGVEFAVEGKDIVRDLAVWDGYTDITLEITGGTGPDGVPVEGGTDMVRLRLSPVMTHHHLQPAEQIMVAGLTGIDSAVMRADLKKANTAAKVPKTVLELKASSVQFDQWTQDYIEPAYMTMPGPDGLHVMRVIYRSANTYNPSSKTNPLRPAGRVAFTTLRGKDVGAVQEFDLKHPGNMDSLDSFGNTETVPPYKLGDKSYPLGRLLRGNVKSFYTDKKFSAMMEAQRQQPPIYIDTSWLLVGHVDETVSFIKAPTPRGWAVIVNDVPLAKKMLEEQVAKGNGGVKMFIGKSWLGNSGGESPAEATIQEVLDNPDVMKESAASAVEVDNQLEILKKELGLTEDEILRSPFLHEPVSGYSLAYQVGTVNGIYLSDTDFGAPTPHGPKIDGKDIFEAQFEAELAKVGIKVRWIEDWDLYHRLSGEVHCGTNTLRKVSPDEKWWESGY